MLESAALAAVLLLLYVLDGIHAVPRDAVLFGPLPGRRPSVRGAARRAGTMTRGLVVSPLSPPLRGLAAATPWPFSVSPQGVSSWVGESFNPGPRPPRQERFVRFDRITSIEAEGAALRINAEAFLDAGSGPRARHAAAL
ncbi:MAG TPA: hypothetical protein VJV23_16940, partial [Candidatus Polarisedimenticolia bacterium]|nr:hypothetical protein [Candidatus Polarisedimenticolia bacterium]